MNKPHYAQFGLVMGIILTSICIAGFATFVDKVPVEEPMKAYCKKLDGALYLYDQINFQCLLMDNVKVIIDRDEIKDI